MQSWTALIMFTNHAVNFPLYVLTGPRFKQELMSLLGCKSAAVQPASGNSTSQPASTLPTQETLPTQQTVG